MEKHYNIHIEYTFPDAQEVTDLVRAKGMFSFYEDGHQECCRIRKVNTCESPVRRSQAPAEDPGNCILCGMLEKRIQSMTLAHTVLHDPARCSKSSC